MHIPEKHLETYARQRVCADIEAGKGPCDRQGYEPPEFIPILFFCAVGIISSARIHPYPALLCCRDYFFHPDSSLSCPFVLQGLFLPPRFILILLFCAVGIISSARIHPQLDLLFRRDYFFRPNSSLSCSFVLQGLFLPLGFIFILPFCAVGIIFSARIHPYPALLCCRDYFFRPDSSLSCSFVLQGLFLPARFIPSLIFCSEGMIPSARIHPQLDLLFRRDDSFRPDSSLSCSFVLQII